MAIVRIIPCLDLRGGRVVKGKNFDNVADLDDPLVLAQYYNEAGADELVFYDITASNEDRMISRELIGRLGGSVEIPFTVGGGVNSMGDFAAILEQGAARVSLNSGALKQPGIIKGAAARYGSGRVVLSVDLKKTGPGRWHVFSGGGREDTGMDALEWCSEGVKLGAGELVVNSIDGDGTRDGYDLEFLGKIVSRLDVPVVASGGAGKLEHFYHAAGIGVQGLLAAGVFHHGIVKIRELKEYLRSKGIEVNL